MILLSSRTASYSSSSTDWGTASNWGQGTLPTNHNRWLFQMLILQKMELLKFPGYFQYRGKAVVTLYANTTLTINAGRPTVSSNIQSKEISIY